MHTSTETSKVWAELLSLQHAPKSYCLQDSSTQQTRICRDSNDGQTDLNSNELPLSYLGYVACNSLNIQYSCFYLAKTFLFYTPHTMQHIKLTFNRRRIQYTILKGSYSKQHNTLTATVVTIVKLNAPFDCIFFKINMSELHGQK